MQVNVFSKMNKIVQYVEQNQCSESILDQKITKLFSKISMDEHFKPEFISFLESLQIKIQAKAYQSISDKLKETIESLRKKPLWDRHQAVCLPPHTFPLKDSIVFPENVSNVTIINQLDFNFPMSYFFNDVIDDNTPCIVSFRFMRYHILDFKKPENWLFFEIQTKLLSCFCQKMTVLNHLIICKN